MSYDSLLINTSDIIHRTFTKWGDEDTRTTVPDRPCRIEYQTRLMKAYNGEDVLSFAVVFYGRDETIEHQDLIKFDGIEHAIITIKRPQDSNVIHHKEVWIQ